MAIVYSKNEFVKKYIDAWNTLFYLNSGLLCRDGREKVEGRESRILRQDEQQSEGKTKPTPDGNEYA